MCEETGLVSVVLDEVLNAIEEADTVRSPCKGPLRSVSVGSCRFRVQNENLK